MYPWQKIACSKYKQNVVNMVIVYVRAYQTKQGEKFMKGIRKISRFSVFFI